MFYFYEIFRFISRNLSYHVYAQHNTFFIVIHKFRYVESFQFERICEYFPRSRHHRKPLSLFFFTSHIFAQAYETKTFFNQITAWIAILILKRNFIISSKFFINLKLSFLAKWHGLMYLLLKGHSDFSATMCFNYSTWLTE